MKLLSYHCNLYTDISKNQSVETMSTYLSKFKSNEKKKKKTNDFFSTLQDSSNVVIVNMIMGFFTCVNSVILWLNLMNNNKISDFNGLYGVYRLALKGNRLKCVNLMYFVFLQIIHGASSNTSYIAVDQVKVMRTDCANIGIWMT